VSRGGGEISEEDGWGDDGLLDTGFQLGLHVAHYEHVHCSCRATAPIHSGVVIVADAYRYPHKS
jgi:hypothetical protein